MRNLFLAVAKVFGLLQVYYALAYVTSIIPIVAMFAQTASDPGVEVAATSFSGANLPFTLAGLLATLALSVAVAWLLLCRTNWLADKLNIPDEQTSGGLEKDSILPIAITLIGVYITANAAPALVAACLLPGYFSSRWLFNWLFSSVLPPALRLSFGLLLAIRPTLVLRLLTRGEKTQGKRLIIGSAAILAILLAAGWGVSRYDNMNRPVYRSSRSVVSRTTVPQRSTQRVSKDQWYRLDETVSQTDTNEFPEFTNANIQDVIEFLESKSEMQNKASQDTSLRADPER